VSQIIRQLALSNPMTDKREGSSSGEDWRLRGQGRYLHGIELKWREYTRFREGWDHDHCEFCHTKFMEKGNPDCLHEGYASEDQYHWICEDCFDDFNHRFQWDVVDQRKV
jgi:hypothetical protein